MSALSSLRWIWFERSGQRCVRLGVALLFPMCLTSAQGRSDGMVFFPGKRVVEAFVADGTAHRFGAAKTVQANLVRAHVGGIVPLVGSNYNGIPFQIGIGASVHMELNPGESISVMSTEYYLDYAILDVLWLDSVFNRLSVGHTSHHLGDHIPAGADIVRPIDYSRDYVQLYLGYTTHSMRFYVGANYAYRFIIDKPIQEPWLIHMGGDGTIIHFTGQLAAYWGLDVKLRQESSLGSTQRYQIGLQFRSSTERILRLAFSHQTGLEDRGQFHGTRRTHDSVGLYLEW